jgi:hypothetical protein
MGPKKAELVKGKGHENHVGGDNREEVKKGNIGEKTSAVEATQGPNALDARCAKIADLLVEGKTGHQLELALREWEETQVNIKSSDVKNRYYDTGGPPLSTTSSPPFILGSQVVLDSPSPRTRTGPIRRNRHHHRTMRDHSAPYPTSPTSIASTQRTVEENATPSISTSPILDNTVPLTSMFKRPSSPSHGNTASNSSTEGMRSSSNSGEMHDTKSGIIASQQFSSFGSMDSLPENQITGDAHTIVPVQKFEWTGVSHDRCKADSYTEKKFSDFGSAYTTDQ